MGIPFPTIPWIMAPTPTLGRPGVRVAAVPVTSSPIQLVELILDIQQGAAHPLQHPLHPRRAGPCGGEMHPCTFPRETEARWRGVTRDGSSVPVPGSSCSFLGPSMGAGTSSLRVVAGPAGTLGHAMAVVLASGRAGGVWQLRMPLNPHWHIQQPGIPLPDIPLTSCAITRHLETPVP